MKCILVVHIDNISFCLWFVKRPQTSTIWLMVFTLTRQMCKTIKFPIWMNENQHWRLKIWKLCSFDWSIDRIEFSVKYFLNQYFSLAYFIRGQPRFYSIFGGIPQLFQSFFFWYTRRCLNISIIWFESWSLTRTYSLVCGPRNYLVHLKLSYRKYRLDRSTVPVTVSFRLEYPNVRNKLRLKSTSSHKNRPKWLSPLNGINLIDNCQLQFTARYLLFTKCIRSAFWLSL